MPLPAITLAAAGLLLFGTAPRPPAAALTPRSKHAAGASAIVRPRRPHLRRSASVHMAANTSGHLFVMQGDIRRILADAVLVPTRKLNNSVWFPNGPPEGARPVARSDFTEDTRVHQLLGLRPDEPSIFLGWLWWEGEGTAPIDWFVEAAEQFLTQATELMSKRGRVLCGRELPLLALPVVGTGNAGAREVSGTLLTALVERLTRFCAENPIDVVLVTKSRQMLSAAQSTRRKLDRRGIDRGWSLLTPDLRAEARRLSRLASTGELVLFLGSGTCRTVDLPSWSELLREIAISAGLTHAELRQLGKLGLTDQAKLLQHRLGQRSLEAEYHARRRSERAGEYGVPGTTLYATTLYGSTTAVETWGDAIPREDVASSGASEKLTAEEVAKRAWLARLDTPSWRRAADSGSADVGAARGTGSRFREALYEGGTESAAAAEASAGEGEGKAVGWAGASQEAAQEAGLSELQRLASELLSCEFYSLTHGLLAGVPHEAAVTTNSDLSYDLACKAGDTELTVLPYEQASDQRWLLKLHGDVHHPEDIILTYSSATPYGYEREALTGVVQGLLITKHILFVGFSLLDDAFNQIAASVRRSLESKATTSRSPSLTLIEPLNNNPPSATAATASNGQRAPPPPPTMLESDSDEYGDDFGRPWYNDGFGNSPTAFGAPLTELGAPEPPSDLDGPSTSTAASSGTAARGSDFGSVDGLEVFGSALTLSDRPFLSELWPELDCIAMGEGAAESEADRVHRWRVLEIFLDRVCLEVTQSAEHLLDFKFSGSFTEADLELRREIAVLVDGLRNEPECQQASAFAVVRQMLAQLGCLEDEVEGLMAPDGDTPWSEWSQYGASWSREEE